MKKIISLLSVFAMVATMFTTVAFADENNYYAISEVSNENNTLVLSVTANTDKELKNLNVTLSMANIVTEEYGLTMADFTVVKGVDATAGSKSDSKKNIAFSVASATSDATGAFDLGTITINTTNLKKDFSFPAPTLKIQDAGKNDMSGYFTDKLTTYVVKAPSAGKPEITINDKYVFNFTAEEGQDVMVTLKRTNGITSDLTYALPKDVKGTASIFGLLKVVDATVVSGDKFDIDVVDANRNVVKPITTITVD